MANFKPLKADFEREREKVRQGIADRKHKYYGVLLMAKYPEVKQKDIYNVLHGGLQKWDVLEKIAEVVGVEIDVPTQQQVA